MLLATACSGAELASNSSSGVLGDELPSASGDAQIPEHELNKMGSLAQKATPGSLRTSRSVSTFFSQGLFALNFVVRAQRCFAFSPSQPQLMGGPQYRLLRSSLSFL